MVSGVTLNSKASGCSMLDVSTGWDGVITKMKCDLQSNVIPYLEETGYFWTRKPLKSSYHGWNNRQCKFARKMIFCSICSLVVMLIICRHPQSLGLSFVLVENQCTLDFKQWLAEDLTKRVHHRIAKQLTSQVLRDQIMSFVPAYHVIEDFFTTLIRGRISWRQYLSSWLL